MRVPIRTDSAGPLERLAAIRDYTIEAKEAKAGVSARIMTDLSQHIPGATMAAVARLVTSERFAVRGTNLFISNVPGAQSSEERRVGKECARTCRSRWSTSH